MWKISMRMTHTAICVNVGEQNLKFKEDQIKLRLLKVIETILRSIWITVEIGLYRVMLDFLSLDKLCSLGFMLGQKK